MLATNANRTVTEFLDTRRLAPARERRDAGLGDGRRQSVEHGAPARAVSGSARHARVSAQLVTDDQIRATIRQDAEALGYVWDPHGATAAHVYHHAPDGSCSTSRGCCVATAHPAKFNEIVEPLVGREIPVPPALARLLSLPRQEEELEPTLDALRARLV